MYQIIETIAGILVGIGLIFFGTYTIFDLLKSTFKLREVMSWPSVKGEIIGARITYVGSDTLLEGSYKPTIRYRYTVNSTYESEKVRIEFSCLKMDLTFKFFAEALIAKYPMNSIIDVYYDPKKPHIACLEKKVCNPVGNLLVGMAMILGGLYITLIQLDYLLKIY